MLIWDAAGNYWQRRGRGGTGTTLAQNAVYCPNAGVEAAPLRSDPTNILGILGPQIVNLMLLSDLGPAMPDFRKSISTKCGNLASLVIGLKSADAFFTGPNMKKTNLFLAGAKPMRSYSDDIACIAKNTGGLRKITLFGPRFERPALEQLACANEFIETVHVCFKDPELNVLGDLSSVSF